MQSDDPRWEVLPNPTIRELTPYTAPPTDHADPVVLVGRPDTPGRRFRGSGFALVFWSPSALMVVAMATDSSGPAVVGLAVCLLVAWVARVWFIAVRVPRWKQPELIVNGENVIVTDVTGARQTVAWADVHEMTLAMVDAGMMTDELHLSWDTPTEVTCPTGKDLDLQDEPRRGLEEANLGDSLDATKVRDALTTHAPASVDLHAGPERGIFPA